MLKILDISPRCRARQIVTIGCIILKDFVYCEKNADVAECVKLQELKRVCTWVWISNPAVIAAFASSFVLRACFLFFPSSSSPWSWSVQGQTTPRWCHARSVQFSLQLIISILVRFARVEWRPSRLSFWDLINLAPVRPRKHFVLFSYLSFMCRFVGLFFLNIFSQKQDIDGSNGCYRWRNVREV